ncbi:STAS domain-containing protein [Micromonospora sp. NPDC126480]|uniref:STAS domain-containing protein n=1 Tax=Micromonospora sp. NPDC126480 TaxID=3155312 RepID=UPI0033190143
MTRAARVVEVAGEVDLSTAHLLVEFVEMFGVHSAGPVHLDLSRVTFFSAHGISAVLRVSGLVAAAGGRLTVCDPAPCVRRLLALTGVDAGLDLDAAGRTDALHAWAARTAADRERG